MILTFDREHLKRLLAATKEAEAFNPTYDQLYDPKLRKDDKELTPGAFPTGDDVDTSKVPPGLWLVADQGVYLMSNARVNLPTGAKRDMAYAKEADPDKVPFDEWWDARGRVFGGDDGVEFLELDLIEKWLERSHLPNAQVELTPTQLKFL